MKLLLKGIGVSAGKAGGKVKVIKELEQRKDFKEGDVLVTHITDPTMTVMMNRAAAIVCDIGGITSHPAIVSREMGIPCVVNCKNATTQLKDGMEVMVDGEKGEVYA